MAASREEMLAEAYKRGVVLPPDAPDGAMLAGAAWPVVLDLYAGSGALGLEALSRGAASCTFVEQDAPAIRALRANVANLRAAADCLESDGKQREASSTRAIATMLAASLGPE